MTAKPTYPDYQSVKETRVYIDPQLNQMAVSAAINAWNAAMNGAARLTITTWDENPSPPAIVIRAVNSKSGMIAASHVNGTAAITYPWDGSYPSSLIYIATDRVSDSMQYSVILHEIGHSFGADDVHDGSLMEPTYSGKRCIDEKTMSQVVKHMHTSLMYANYCY